MTITLEFTGDQGQGVFRIGRMVRLTEDGAEREMVLALTDRELRHAGLDRRSISDADWDRLLFNVGRNLPRHLDEVGHLADRGSWLRPRYGDYPSE